MKVCKDCYNEFHGDYEDNPQALALLGLAKAKGHKFEIVDKKDCEVCEGK